MIGPVVQLDDTYLRRLRRRDPEALRAVIDEQGLAIQDCLEGLSSGCFIGRA